MDPATVVALIAVLVSLPISITAIVQSRRSNAISAKSTAAAERAAQASERQTEIQEALSRRTAEPSLWVDIRPDDPSGQLLMLVVGNSGPTIATNVVVTFDPPLRDTPFDNDQVRHGEERLNAGLASLPPGRVLSWTTGVAHRAFSNPAAPMSYAVTITADGPFGPIEPLAYTINLNDMRNNRQASVAPGTLYGITEAVRDLGKTAKVIADNTRRPAEYYVEDYLSPDPAGGDTKINE